MIILIGQLKGVFQSTFHLPAATLFIHQMHIWLSINNYFIFVLFNLSSLISMQKFKEFSNKNEASQSNKHLYKRIIIKPPFMHWVYSLSSGVFQVLASPQPTTTKLIHLLSIVSMGFIISIISEDGRVTFLSSLSSSVFEIT